jgi:thymidylate kinase
MESPTSSSEAGTHPVLRRLFSALTERGLSWALLRVPSDLAAPTGDVDVLVAPADAGALRRVAEALGFVALPGWSAPPNLILVSYDRPTNRWLLLDVVTEISFRSPPSWALAGAAAEVLGRRQVHGATVVPADDDAFWLLLLHCLLDRGTVAAHYRAPLSELAPGAVQSKLARIALDAAGPPWTATRFTDLVLREEWQALEDLSGPLADALNRRRTGSQRLRAAAADVLATVRKPFLLRRRRGVNVALIGPNGAGKSTTAAELQHSLPFDSRVVYMGLWKRSGGRPPRMLAEILGRPLRIWHRYAQAQYHQLRGRLVIFDRYVYEARLPAQPPWLALKRPYFWILGHMVPPAQTSVVLDVPADVAYARKQENSADELASERRFYAALAGRIPALQVVDGSRDVEAVSADVTAILWPTLVRRWHPADTS